MVLIDFLKRAIRKYFFNPKWRCVNCGKEIFDQGYFCAECKNQLPVNDGAYCEHCGRELLIAQNYCSTCRENLLSLDKCRSAFSYKKPISTLIKRFKYGGKLYLADTFNDYLSSLYFKNYFNSDLIVYVPMTEKAEKKRGYNQSKILAEKLSSTVGVKVIDAVVKIKQTDRQAKLNRKQRMQNLANAFRVVKKSEIKDKSVLIVDDVTTTGATAEALAFKLKNAGAKTVNLISVASVPPSEKY